MIELDLYGLSVSEALATVVAKYNALLGTEHRELVVVHGYGSSGEGGVLKHRIRSFLQSAKVSFRTEQDGFHGNRGQTVVLIGNSLLSVGQGLEDKMLDYCTIAKTKEKIFAKFHKSGTKALREAFSALVSKGLLKQRWKGKNKVWIKTL